MLLCPQAKLFKNIVKSCRNHGNVAKRGDKSPKFATLLLLQPLFEARQLFKTELSSKILLLGSTEENKVIHVGSDMRSSKW